MSSDANAHTVPVPHGSLAVVDEGSGRPVVLLHAGICDLRSWDPLVPSLLAGGLRVIRYDARGYGGSTTEDAEYSPTDDLLAVLDACAVDQALLVGNSRGGYVAIETALDHPARVVGVVGVGAGVRGYDPPLSPEEDALFAEMDRLEESEPVDVEAIADLDVRVWVDGPGQRTDRVDPSIREYVRDVDRAFYAPGNVRGRPTRPAVDAAARLPELVVPVVMVAGTLDVSEVVPVALHVAERAANARAVVWDDVAHLIGLEQPERLAGLITSLADELGDWS